MYIIIQLDLKTGGWGVNIGAGGEAGSLDCVLTAPSHYLIPQKDALTWESEF